MTTSELKAGERVKDVRFSEDSISVDLVEGEPIRGPLRLIFSPSTRWLASTPEEP